MKKLNLIILCIFFNLLLLDSIYAASESKFYRSESSTTAGYSLVENEVYFNQLMNLENISVKFTQDASDYIFRVRGKITLDVYNDIKKSNSYNSASSLAPMLYKTENFGEGVFIKENSKLPYVDCNAGSMYEQSVVKISNEFVATYENSYRLTSNGYTDWVLNRGGNGDKYYIPNNLRCRDSTWSYNYKGSSQYPENTNNNGVGVKILKNSISYNYGWESQGYLGIYTANIDITLAIDKRYIDDYRYICFAQSYLVNTEETVRELHSSIKGFSLCTQTVDLKEYSECEHNWTITIIDKTNHKKYCSNCEWEITEPHNYEFEYDGITNDICICSHVKKVKYQFKINDNSTKEVTKTFDTDSEYTKVEFKQKTGYNFMYYDVYEKRLISQTNLSKIHNDLNIVKLSTSKVLPDKTGQMSMIFEAKYDPIHFKINYSNENNKNIVLNGSIAPQTIAYNSTAYLKKHIHHIGYVFKGWSLTRKGSKVDMIEFREVTNYSAVDGFNLTIYPVYASIDFKLIYSSGRGHFPDGSNYKEINYTYHDDKELEKVIIDDNQMEFSHYIDDFGNKYYKMSDIKDVMEKNGVENVTLSLFPLFKKKESTAGDKEEETTKKNENVEPSINPTSPTDYDNESSDDRKHESSEPRDEDGKEKESSETKINEQTTGNKNTEPTTKKNDISPEENHDEDDNSGKSKDGNSDDKSKVKEGDNTEDDKQNATTNNNSTVDNSNYNGGGSRGGSGGSSGGNYISSSNMIETTTRAHNIIEDSSINVSVDYNLLNIYSISEQDDVATTVIIEESSDEDIEKESESMNEMDKEEIDEDDIEDVDGEDIDVERKISTASFITTNNSRINDDYNSMSKKELILRFIRNNKLLVAVCSSLFIILFILYEVLIIKHYYKVHKVPFD